MYDINAFGFDFVIFDDFFLREFQASVLHFTGNNGNSVACARSVNLPQTMDLSGNGVITLPTITENKTQHLLGSDLSTTSHTSASSKEISSAETPPYKEKKIFTVTVAKAPV
jgi:hypothetical protein